MSDTTPIGFKTVEDVQSLTATNKLFQNLLDYLKSINVNVLIDDYKITVRDYNFNLSLYIYNAMFVIHGTIHEPNSLVSQMFVKQGKDCYSDYIIVYEPEKTSVHMRFKLSGNEIYDASLPVIAFVKMVDLVNTKTVSNLLPKSLQ
jgi:hypothetical protein